MKLKWTFGSMFLKLEIASELLWDLGKDSDSMSLGGIQVGAFLTSFQGS